MEPFALCLVKNLWSWLSHCSLLLKDCPWIWNVQMRMRKFFLRTITQTFNRPQVRLNIKCLTQSQPLTRLNLFFGAPHRLSGNCCDFWGKLGAQMTAPGFIRAQFFRCGPRTLVVLLRSTAPTMSLYNFISKIPHSPLRLRFWSVRQILLLLLTKHVNTA